MLGRYTTGPSDEGGGYQTFRAILAAPMPIIDLRSDTVTKPSPEMRRAMAEAEVGDDVFEDDPPERPPGARAAEPLARGAGFFVPPGGGATLVAKRPPAQGG